MVYLEVKFATQFSRLKRRQRCDQTDDAYRKKRLRRSHISSPDVLEILQHHSDIEASLKFMSERFIDDDDRDRNSVDFFTLCGTARSGPYAALCGTRSFVKIFTLRCTARYKSCAALCGASRRVCCNVPCKSRGISVVQVSGVSKISQPSGRLLAN
jgi:hypothetical protein